MKPNSLSFPLLFHFPNNIDSIVISLRSITSYFILNECISSLSDIELIPLSNCSTKLIDLVKDDESDYIYMEHPLSFEILYKNQTKLQFLHYKHWLESCIELSRRYNHLYSILKTFYTNELESKLNPQLQQIEYLENSVPFFHRSMILSFFQFHFQFEHSSMDYMKSVNWNSILYGHVHACRVLFDQITSTTIRNRILNQVFEIVKLFQPRLEKVLHQPDRLQQLIVDFKKETNKVIQDNAQFVNTKKISFRSWILSLTQFYLHCSPFDFPIKESLVHLNMILYLCFGNDEIQMNQKVCIRKQKEETVLSNHQITKLKTIHPFVRNIYHSIYT